VTEQALAFAWQVRKHGPVAAVTFNPFEPGFADNPYDQYAGIRAQGRAERTAFGTLLLSHYDDCFGLLRLAGTSVDDRHASNVFRYQPPEDIADRMVPSDQRRSILGLDPPDHTRLRRLVSNAFTVRRIEQLRGRVRELVAGLLDEVAEAGAGGDTVDLIARYAFPLPFMVISELLGMPEGNRDELRGWSHKMTLSLEPAMDDHTARAVVDATEHMVHHVDEAIDWRRRHPADDLLSAMIAAEEDGDRMTAEELQVQVILLYLAGHETTVNLIGNGTLALLRHRDQYERLNADRSLDATAVEELLRYDSPVQLSRRIALTEIEVGGETAQPGEMVMTLLGSANHDQTRWGPTADDLDLGREGASAHLSFGSGVHHCLGAALARLEGAEAIPALVRRFPGMEPASDRPAWNGRVVLRGLDALPVSLG
jgi:cytochrome P450